MGRQGSPPALRRVFQQHEDGCGIACVAMLAGISYAEACLTIFGDVEGDATSFEDLRWALKAHGLRLAPKLKPFWEGPYEAQSGRALLAVNPLTNGMWHWAVWDGANRRILDPLRHPPRQLVVGYAKVGVIKRMRRSSESEDVAHGRLEPAHDRTSPGKTGQACCSDLAVPVSEVASLSQAVQSQHGGRATFVSVEPVDERHNGQPVWQREVHVFDLDDNPEATRAYAWSSPVEGSDRRRFYAVLHLGPIRSARDAVRAAMLAEHRSES